MKKIILALMFFCLACASTVPKQKIVVGNISIKKYHTSVGRIFVKNKDGSELLGTAFAIDDEHLITAGHVCLGFVKAQFSGMSDGNIYLEKMINDKKVEIGGIEIVRADIGMFDLCELKKRDHGLLPLNIVKNYKEIKYLDDVWAYGSIQGNFPTPTGGYVINADSRDHSPIYESRLLISSAISHGNSGGPVMNNRGEVIGVISAKAGNFDHFGICITANELKVFLNLPQEFFNSRH